MKMHPLLKAISVFAILMSFSLLSTGSEIFSTNFNEADNWDNPGGSWTAYNEKTYSEGAWFFHSTSAVRGTAAESFDGSDYSFRDRDVFSLHNTESVSNMSGFSLQLRDWMLGSGEQRNLNVSYDGGENWELLVTINKDWFDAYQVYQEYVYFFPGGPQTFDAEQFKLEIDGGNDANNGRINIGEFVAYGTMTTVATPAFNPAGGEFLEALDVEITTATPGASIYYTLNGADPTQSDNLYTTPVPVDDDVTIKARAFADGMDPSATSQATFTFPEITEVATLAALRDMPVDGSYYKYTGNAVIVAMDSFRNRKFIQDETAAILIDDNPGVITTEYDLYDVITDVTGKLDVFNNMLRFQPALNTPQATLNTPVEPVVFALDEVEPGDQAKLIRFEEVSFTSKSVFANGQNYTISDGFNEFIFRTDFWDVDYIGDPVPTLPVNISGVMIQYQDDLQIVARFQDDIELADPPDDPGIITLSTTSLPSFRNVYTGNVSDVQFYTVEASNLDGNLTITAGSPLKVSLNCTDDFATTLLINETDGNVDEHTIYVRAFPVSTGNFNPVINHSDGFVAKAITTQVTGTASQIPSGYYSTATGFGEVLMTQLHNIINDHTVLTYESIWGHFETTDARFDGSVWDVFSYVECEDPPYSYVFFDDQQGAGTYPDVEGVVYNREHLWPQSWWSGSDPSPMVTDLHHVYPADRWVNSQKSNYPFGEISNPMWTSEAGNKIGNNAYGSAYSGMAFEPVDELKGDFARTYFYMATRYMDQLPDWSSHTVASNVLDGSEFPGFEPWFINMLLEWHENNPVSQKEIERNNAIYGLQNNRNPFIDNPDFAYLVWGDVPDIPVGELCNLDFEDWFNDLPYCWYGGRSNIPQSSVSRYEDNPQSGSYAVRLVNTASGHRRFTTHSVSVTDGIEYAITFWAKGKGEVRTGLFDERDTGFGYAPYNDYVIVDSDEWSQHTQSVTAANTSDIAEFIFSLRNTDEVRNHLQIDNVSIEIVEILDPTLFVDPATLIQLNYVEGAGPSASKSFEVSGVNLDGSEVIITAPGSFEVSSDNVSFSASVTLPSFTGADTDIFARLQAGLEIGSYSGNLLVDGGGAAEKTVALSGAVTAPVEPFDIPYANAFRSQEDNDAAEAVGFVIEDAQNATGGGGYLQIFPGGYLETPAIDFSAYQNLLFAFDATTFGGVLGQSLTLMISTDGGSSYDALNTWELTGSYVTYEELIDLSKTRSANGKLKIEMTAGGGSSRFRDFSLTEEVIPDLVDPVLSLEAGTYFENQTVFVSNHDDYAAGISLFYTTDGETPDGESEPYNHSLGIELLDGEGAITLKVIAIETATGSQSNITTAQYIFPLNVASIAALRSQKSATNLYRLMSEAVLTFQTENRNQKYIQDATAAILIDDNAGTITTEYDLYDGITGIVGSLTTFSQMLRFVPELDPGAVSSVGNTVVPVEVVLDDLTTTYQAQLVLVNNVLIDPNGDTNFAEGKSYTITDASGTGILRTAYPDLDYLGDPIPTVSQNLVGVVLQFNDDIQLVPRSSADFEELLDPNITTTPASLSGFGYLEGEGPSPEQSFNVSGSQLDPETGNLTAIAGPSYEVSMDAAKGFSATLDLPYSGGTLASTALYVRLKAGLAEGEYNENLTITGGSADPATVSLTGEVVVPPGIPYAQDFDAFVSTETLPVGWTVSDDNYNGDWGTGTSAGLRGNANVLGYQHTAATGIFTAELTLINTTGETITDLDISYMGMVERAGENRSPEWTVEVDGQEVEGLFYSTADGIDKLVEASVHGLNIAPGESVTISWSSDRGLPSGSSKQIGIGNVSVDVGEAPDVATPVLNPGAGTYYADQTVFVSNYDDYPSGISLFYTTDGTNPNDGSEAYNHSQGILLEDGQGPITLKVIAINTTSGSQSSIVTAEYIFPVNVESIAELRNQKSTGTLYRLTGGAVITLQGDNPRNQRFIQDETAGILIDDNAGILVDGNYNIGDVLENLIGTVGVFNNMVQLIPTIDLASVTNTQVFPEPITVGIDDLNTDQQGMLILVEGLTYQGSAGDFEAETSYPFRDVEQNNLTLRTVFSDLDYIGEPIPETPQNITGVHQVFGTTLQIIPRNLEDFEAVEIDTPFLSVSPQTLSGFTYLEDHGPSDAQQFTVSGENLVSGITITAPESYLISLSADAGYTNEIVLPLAGLKVSQTDIYVILKEGLTAGVYQENIEVASEGATPRMVALSGEVTEPLVTLVPFETSFGMAGNWTDLPPTGWTGYNPKSYQDGGWLFHSTEAVRGGTAESYNGSAYSFRDRGTFTLSNMAAVSDMTGFSLQLRDWMDGAGVIRPINVSFDGGNNWQLIGEINKDWFEEYQVYQEFVHYFEEAKDFDADNFMVEVAGGDGTNSSRINIGQFKALDQEPPPPPAIAAPVFDPPAGTYYQDLVVFVDNYDGYDQAVSVFYTLNGDVPDANSPLYDNTSGIQLTDGDGPITLKAIAIDGEEQSHVTAAEYIFPVNVESIAELRNQKSTGTLYRLTSEAILTFQTENRNQKYIQDETAAILIDDNAGNITTEYAIYDGLTGLVGTLSAFNNMMLFVPVRDPGAASSSGNTVTPGEVVLDDLNPGHQAQLVSVTNVEINPGGDTEFVFETSYALTDASGNGILRTVYSDLDYIGESIPATPQNLTAVVLQFGTQLQLIPRSWDDFEAAFPGTHVVEFFVVDENGSLAASVDGVDITSGDLVETGSNVLFTASPDEGYQVKEWTVNDLVVKDRTQETLLVEAIDTDISVTVAFEVKPPPSYVVEFFVVGSNGTLVASVSGEPINSGDLVEEGKSVLFTATPDEGYQIKQWRRNGLLLFGYTLPTYTFNNLNQNITITVEFEPLDEPEPEDLHIAIEEDVIVFDEECFFVMGTITVAGGDFVFTVKEGAEAQMAAGQKIRFLPGSNVESGGSLHAYISEDNPCARPFAEEITPDRENLSTSIDVIDDEDGSLFFKLYPNPAELEITLEMGHFLTEQPVRIEILNSMGNLMFSEVMAAQHVYRLDLADKNPGMYIVRVIQGNRIAVERLIKR